ncbi:unnamed protein product [Arctogadus glacialis]
MKDATTLISEESSPTVCLIAPLQAQLCKETTGNIAESSITRDIKKAINEDLSKRYTSDLERRTLRSASALDPRFKQQVRVEEHEVTEGTQPTEEQNQSSPPAKRRAPSSLLENLLGNTFSSATQPISAYAQAEEEVNKFRGAPVTVVIR